MGLTHMLIVHVKVIIHFYINHAYRNIAKQIFLKKFSPSVLKAAAKNNKERKKRKNKSSMISQEILDRFIGLENLINLPTPFTLVFQYHNEACLLLELRISKLLGTNLISLYNSL